MKILSIAALLFGFSICTYSQSTQEVNTTPPRVSEPVTEMGSELPETPGSIPSGAEINTTPERAKDAETASPAITVTVPVVPAIIETPVNASPAKATETENKGNPE